MHTEDILIISYGDLENPVRRRRRNTKRFVIHHWRRKQYSSFSVPNRGILPEPYYPCEKFTVSKSTAIPNPVDRLVYSLCSVRGPEFAFP